MDKIPIPKSHPGWAAAFFVIAFAFWLYYGYIFDRLSEVYVTMLYGENFDPIPIVLPDKLLTRSDEENQVLFFVAMPKYLSSFTQDWIYISINNQSDFLLANVKVWVNLYKEDKVSLGGNSSSQKVQNMATPDNLHLPPPAFTPTPNLSLDHPLIVPSVYKDPVFNRVLKFASIEPRSVASGRIPISGLGPVWVEFWMSVGSDEKAYKIESPTKGTNIYEIPVDPGKAFKHSLIGNLLLPPWANGFIPAIILLLCSYVEDKACDLVGMPEKLPLLFSKKGGIVFVIVFLFTSMLTLGAFGAVLWGFVGDVWPGLLLIVVGIIGFLGILWFRGDVQLESKLKHLRWGKSKNVTPKATKVDEKATKVDEKATKVDEKATKVDDI